jgi:hypothetical protein
MASYLIIVIFLMLSLWQRKHFCTGKNYMISWFGREDLKAYTIPIKNLKEKIIESEIVGINKITRNKTEHLNIDKTC